VKHCHGIARLSSAALAQDGNANWATPGISRRQGFGRSNARFQPHFHLQFGHKTFPH
jgi:hypothetical protein